MSSDVVAARTPEVDDELGSPHWVHLRAAGVSLLLRLSPGRLPVVQHWGPDLGDLTGLAAAALLAVWDDGGSDGLPLVSLPGELQGGRTRLLSDAADAVLVQVGSDIVITEVELEGAVSLDLAVQLTADGLVRARAGLTNRSGAAYAVDGLLLRLPTGPAATDQITLQPSGVTARTLGLGRWSTDVEAEDGRPAYVLVGNAGAEFGGGAVWQSHVAFSGAVRHRVERAGGTTYLTGGERLQPGEVVLGSGESYHSPWVLWSYGEGLDAAAARLHAYGWADLPGQAAVFDARGVVADHDQRGLLTQAEYAAAIGVGTFLLDLDWCVRAGLEPHTDSHGQGADGLPQDLDGLLARIRGLDLAVGLTITPEVSEVDEAVVRDHPDWLVPAGPGGGRVPTLDLAVRSAMGFVWERLTKLLDRHDIARLHWEIQQPHPASGHASTRAAYRLLDALRERYPTLAISTGTVDLAITGRAYAIPASAADARSGALDAVSQLLPPRLTQVVAGAGTGGSVSGAARALASLSGQLGLRLDLRRQSPATLRGLHRWLAWHEGVQPLLHRGRVVRAGDGGTVTRGVVAEDGSGGIFAVLAPDQMVGPARIRLPGLDPSTDYQVEVVGDGAWPDEDPVVVTGRVLAGVGLPASWLGAGDALLLHLSAAHPLEN